MAAKQAFPEAKSDNVFGQARKPLKMFRADSAGSYQACLAHARQNGKRLGRPLTAALEATEIRPLPRTGISKSEIARRLQIGHTSVRRPSLFRGRLCGVLIGAGGEAPHVIRGQAVRVPSGET